METLNNYEKNENGFFSSISDSEVLFIFFQIKRHGCLKFNYYQKLWKISTKIIHK